MNNVPLYKVRSSDLWVSSRKAAAMVGMSVRWVQKHKGRFTFRRRGKALLEFELASVLEVWNDLERQRWDGKLSA